MTQYRNHVASLLAITFGLFAAAPARAASLQSVATSAWSGGDVPTYISMYIYVPDKVATNPPILVVAHYCGGSASGVFGEAQGGGIVSAADTNGFIMIYPQTTNPATSADCWDVGSAKSLTHNGGGDTQAIAEMVSYTITKYSANANRVYATGTSSGAMMTEALLAVYPDVFKAGAEFSGVPAGCWSDGWSAASNWGGTCASGGDIQTAQAWGNMVRAMYSAYPSNGYRPRIQLWHGTADAIINYQNQLEAIKEWTNVLALSTNPTSTSTVTLNSHTWTRQSWQNSCGYTVLDAWAETNGPHGTDANLNSTYVIPFLGLDQTVATDPEVAQCGTGGTGGGTGGATSTGGTPSTGGTKATGGVPSTGGTRSSGGTPSTGGATTAAGGTPSTGGSKPSGGSPSAGGTIASGGMPNTGGSALIVAGNSATGGVMNTGGVKATGGMPGTGGLLGSGGTLGATGGASANTQPLAGTTSTNGATTGGNPGTTTSSTSLGGQAGATGTGTGSSSDVGSCSCRTVGTGNSPRGALGGLILAACMTLIRSRRRRQFESLSAQ